MEVALLAHHGMTTGATYIDGYIVLGGDDRLGVPSHIALGHAAQLGRRVSPAGPSAISGCTDIRYVMSSQAAAVYGKRKPCPTCTPQDWDEPRVDELGEYVSTLLDRSHRSSQNDPT
jgi:hypothetical protein